MPRSHKPSRWQARCSNSAAITSSIAAPRGLAFIDGDEFRLAQMFQNLLTNAAKYTPSGGSVTVRLTRARATSVVAEVEDNGEGIAADVLPTVFDPFVQGAQTLDRSQGGLGIGLTLVRSLVEMHGGRVEAHSDGRGHGSRFRVTLPLALATTPAAQGTPQGMAPLKTCKHRILLVDDNRDAAEMLAELLRAAGHEVVVAYDGPSALGVLPDFKPDVALLDIGLPVMDGYDLARKLRRALPEPPRLIAITGYGQEHDHRAQPRGRLRCPPRKAGAGRAGPRRRRRAGSLVHDAENRRHRDLDVGQPCRLHDLADREHSNRTGARHDEHDLLCAIDEPHLFGVAMPDPDDELFGWKCAEHGDRDERIAAAHVNLAVRGVVLVEVVLVRGRTDAERCADFLDELLAKARDRRGVSSHATNAGANKRPPDSSMPWRANTSRSGSWFTASAARTLS